MKKINADLADLKKELWLRRRNNSIIAWTTKNGRQIPINEMTDARLVDTIRMITYQQAEEKQRRQEEFEKSNCEIKDKPNGRIVSEDFSEGNGFYKLNLAYLSKEQVEEIENIVKKWNPELAESEDEKIRKDIRQCIKLCSFVPSNGTTKDEMFAWLEKQGKQKQQDREDLLQLDDALGSCPVDLF